MCTFYNSIGGYPVSLSSIGEYNKFAKRFPEVISQKPQKTRFCEVFWTETYLFLYKTSVLLFEHLLHFNRWLPCNFRLSRSYAASLRSVFLKYCRKNPKKHVFSTFSGPKLTFSTKVVIFNICATFAIK